MGRKKSNPNAEIECETERLQSPEILVNTSSALINALKSPYEPSSIEDTIFVLCRDSHATVKELSTILCLDIEYLEKEMIDVIEKGITACKILLRHKQLASAVGGDSKQLTWMGKQVLGQEDKATLDLPVNIVIATGITRNPVKIVETTATTIPEKQLDYE